jgi:hypothetical protein
MDLFMKKIKYLLVLGAISFLTACGGGASSDGATDEQQASLGNLIDSGKISYESDGYSSAKGAVYDITGVSDVFYDTENCATSILTSENYYSIYDSAFAETVYQRLSSVYSSTCMVNSAYQEVELTNSIDVNADYFSYGNSISDYLGTFYDPTSKIYYEYEYSFGEIPYEFKLIEIINDGMSGIIDTGDGATVTVQLTKALKEVELSTLGMAYDRSPFFEGNSNDLMEAGEVYRIENKPYDISGYLYNYATSGCTFYLHTPRYYIFNDGQILLESQYYNTKNTCNITGLYENLVRSNVQGIDGGYINENTFYDSSTKIFFDIDPDNSDFSDHSAYRLIELNNNGRTAVVDIGDGSTVTVDLLRAYKEVI